LAFNTKPAVPEVVIKPAAAVLADAARLRRLSKSANWDAYAESAVVVATNYQTKLM
jgi:hypothetical protein